MSMDTSATLEVEETPLEQIKPYEGNPRRITQRAINAVAYSLEKYGWRQPIVVDRDHVIIVGHTRFAAAQKLGWETAPVHVSQMSDEDAKAYRLVDNRAAEYSTWDEDKLALEAREFPTEMVDDLFPDLDLEVENLEAISVTNEDVEKAEEKISSPPEMSDASTHTTNVECPACRETYQVRTLSLPYVSEDFVNELIDERQRQK